MVGAAGGVNWLDIVDIAAVVFMHTGPWEGSESVIVSI